MASAPNNTDVHARNSSTLADVIYLFEMSVLEPPWNTGTSTLHKINHLMTAKDIPKTYKDTEDVDLNEMKLYLNSNAVQTG